MSYHSRRMLTPWESRKRKEREATSPKPLIPPTPVSRAVSLTDPATTSSNPKGADQPLSSNRLLAGCMAYEFLSKGTLFGQKFDPARAEAIPVHSADSSKRNRLSQSDAQPSTSAEPSGKPKPKPQSYAEVANLLRSDGAHIPGVVNPTQLARWIQM